MNHPSFPLQNSLRTSSLISANPRYCRYFDTIGKPKSSFSPKNFRNLRQAIFLPAPSDVFSNVGITAQSTVTDEISVQNMTAEDGLKSRQGGNTYNWMKLKV